MTAYTRTLCLVAGLSLCAPCLAHADAPPSPPPQVTVTVTPAPQPLLPAGATPLEQPGTASRSVDSWPGYRLSPGPGGEVEAVVLSPVRYQALVVAPRLVEGQARVDLLVCRGEQRAQSDRHNERALALLARERELLAPPAPDWQRVAAWVGLGLAAGAAAGGTAVWLAR